MESHKASNDNKMRNKHERKCVTAMEQERISKNVFSSEEPLFAAISFAGQKSKPLCVFCKKSHWSDKCRTISDLSSRK